MLTLSVILAIFEGMESNSQLKSVAYARVSTLLGQDPENQLTHIRAFAEARGFIQAGEYIDRISGVKERRKGLDELVRDARMGKFKVLVVSGIDRLARDTRHLLNLIYELDGYGVALISLRESIDFTSPMGKAALTILGAIAELERELCRERIRSALAAKKLTAEKTGWRTGRPPLKPEVIEQVIELHKRGHSLRQIASQLSGQISKSSVERIVKQHKQGVQKTPPKSTMQMVENIESKSQEEDSQIANRLWTGHES